MYLLIASPWQMGHATISISQEKIQNPEILTPTALKQNQSEFCIHMSSIHPSEKHEGLSPRQRSCKPHFFHLLHLAININYWAITQKKNLTSLFIFHKLASISEVRTFANETVSLHFRLTFAEWKGEGRNSIYLRFPSTLDFMLFEYDFAIYNFIETWN